VRVFSLNQAKQAGRQSLLCCDASGHLRLPLHLPSPSPCFCCSNSLVCCTAAGIQMMDPDEYPLEVLGSVFNSFG
jgi:hypothetical protein